MPGTASSRNALVDGGWALFAVANFGAMIAWPSWETVPFHFVWISLTLVYGFRVWEPPATALVLTIVAATTGAAILADAFEGIQLWGELFEVPLMSAMFLAMVWHARRRQAATRRAEALVVRQERFLHDVSHELRTPVTIVRGHLELLQRSREGLQPEVAVALDELGRIERLIARLLLLARTGQPEFLTPSEIDIEPFLEEVFIRWSEVARRSWRLESVAHGSLWADDEALRAALDALLENAVKHTDPHEAIVLRATALGDDLVIEVSDTGTGVPAEAAQRIFDRFARADDARTRSSGGAGLGLAIVAATARAHSGEASLVPSRRGATFVLQLPGFRPSTPAFEARSMGEVRELPSPV